MRKKTPLANPDPVKSFIDSQRLEAIAAATFAGLAVVDLKEKFSYVNQGFAAMMGYESEELLGMKLKNVIIAEEHAKMDDQRKNRRQGLANNYQTIFQKKDGDLVHALVSASPLTTPEGEYNGAQAIVIDISDRIRAEKALSDQEKILNLMVNNTAVGFCATDLRGYVISANSAMVNLLGYTEDELRSMHYNDYSHPDDRQMNAELYEKQIQGEVQGYEIEKRFIHKDGKVIDVLLISQLVWNSEGEPQFEFATIENITDQKIAERRNHHLNLVVKTLRSINKLIVNENDLMALINKTCNTLTENRGYHHAWIALFDENNTYIEYAESGLGDKFDALEKELAKGEIPRCAREALTSGGTFTEEDPLNNCTNCPLFGAYEDRGGFTAILEHGDETHGVLVVSIPKFYLGSIEEHELFQELAGDIAFAIHKIKTQSILEQSQDTLKLQASVLEAVSNAIVITDKGGAIQWANPAFSTLTGYSLDEILGRNPSFLKSGLHEKSFYKELWNKIASGGVWRGEITNKNAQGELYVEEMTITPLINEYNEVDNYIAIKQNITDRAQDQQQLIEQTEDLSLLNKLNELLREGADLDRTYDLLAERTSAMFNSHGATTYLIDEKRQLLIMQGLRYPGSVKKIIEKLLKTKIPDIAIPIDGNSYVSEVIAGKRPIITNDPEHIQAWMGDFALSMNLSKQLREMGRKLIPKIFDLLKIKSLIVIPMIYNNECIGLLDIASSTEFSQADFSRLISITDQITASYMSVKAIQDTEHSEELLLSLSESAARLQRGIDIQDIFRNLGSEIKKIGFDVTVFMLNEDEDHLIVSYHNLFDLVEKLEKMAGMSAAKYSFPIEPDGFYHRIITTKESVYSELDIAPIKEALPPVLRSTAEKIMAMIGSRQTIMTPLIINDRTKGLVAYTGHDLRKADVPALRTFTNQAASALERNQLYQEAKDLAIFSSDIVENIAEGILIEDLQGQFTYANPIAVNMFGTRMEEILGLSWQDILPPSQFMDFEKTTRKQASNQTRIIELDINHSSEPSAILVSRKNYLDHEGFLAGRISICADITDLKRAESESLIQTKRLQSMRLIDQAIIGSFDLDMSLNIILEQIIKQLEADAAAVLIYQPLSQELVLRKSRGFNTTALQLAELRMGEGYAGQVAMTRKPLYIPNLSLEPGEFNRSPEFKLERFVTYYGLPLIAKGKFIGVLELYTRFEFKPDADWENFLKTLGGQVAIAIDNFSLYNDLQRSNIDLTLAYDATIEGWAHALELKDMETEGHSRRVVEATLELARRMGLSKEEIPHIRRGALLHDIGKMGIPDSILQKEGKLTDEEWEIMKQHPVYAYEWLSRIPYLKPALEIPYAHHERWDGTGYPRQLREAGIPKAARIFAIIDVWDALSTDRPYRKAWPREKIIAHIQEQSGKHFDPEVTTAFLNMLAEKYPDEKHWTDRFG